MLKKFKFIEAISATLVVALLAYSVGDLRALLHLNINDSGPKKAHAEGELGKITRTAEFLLGKGTDTTVRTTGTATWASATGWVTSKPAAGSRNVVALQGKNIRVLGAELDVSYEMQNGTAVYYLQQHDVLLDVQGSQTAGVDTAASDVTNRDTSTTYPLQGNSLGGVMTFSAAHDVRGFFTTQTDAEFNAGVSVSVGVKHTSSTASRENTNAKLIITYEADIPTIAGQFLTKTVRLPLDSTAGGSSGTLNSQCLVNTTCNFTFDLSDVPDLTQSNIVSSFIELNILRNPGTAVSITNTLNGSGSVAYALTNTSVTNLRSNQTINYPIATTTLNTLASNTFSVSNASAGSQALNAVGGEVVVTYEYDTSAPSQAETLRYMMYQGTGGSAGTTSNVPMGSISPLAVNSGSVPKSAWMRMRVPVSANATFFSTSTVGSNNIANSFNLTTTGTIRSGDTASIIHDFSSAYTAWGPVSGSYRYSALNPQIATEVLVTYTWDGTMASSRTNTISYPASQGRTTPAAVASVTLSNVSQIAFGESGDKTIKSAYVQVNQHRGDTAPIAAGTLTAMIDSTTNTITEMTPATAKESLQKFYVPIPSSTWNGSASSSQNYILQISESNSAADTAYYNNQVIITYDTVLAQDSRAERSMHTVEFIMGNGSDSTGRASAAQTYVGTSWNTTKALAGQNAINIFGTNVRVISAYADVSFSMSSPAVVYGLILTGDATDGSRALAGMRFSDAPPSGITTDPYSYNSGTTASDGSTGYHRQFDVTPLLSGYSAASLSSGVSVDFGILASQSAGNRELTAVKLVVTYATDEDLNRVGAQVITKTVRFPLATNATSCTTCTFSSTSTIDDLDGGTGSPILSAFYEVSSTNYGTGANSSTISVDDNATSSTLTTSEVSNDISTVKRYFAPPINTTTGYVPNAFQTIRLVNSVAQYGVGGEVVVTYRAYTGSSRNTETVVLPLGQVLVSGTSGTIGTGSMTLPGSNVSISNIWLRVQHPLNNFGSLTIGGKVGAAATRQLAYTYGTSDLVRAQGVPTVIHDLTPDKASYNGTLSATYSISNATGPGTYMNAEAVVTYTNDGGAGGSSMHTIEFVGTPQSYSSVVNRPRANTVPFMVAKNMLSLSYVGAEMKLYHTHTAVAAATNIVAGTLVTNVGSASTTVVESGDLEAYMPSVQLPLTEAQLFRSSILSGSRAVQFVLYQTSANIVQASAVMVLTYTEQHDIARPGYTQAMYRFYADNDLVVPTAPWHPSLSTALGEDAGISSSTRPVRNGESVRIRMDIGISTTTMQANSQQFRLEYALKSGACSTAVGWLPVDGPSGTSIWKGKSGAPGAGIAIGTTTLSLASSAGAGVLGTYEEGATTAVNPNAAIPGQYVEYDWNIMNNGATGDSEYCFRMAKSDGSTLDTYTSYPTIYAAPYTPETLYWKWYTDGATNEPPLAALGAASVVNRTVLKLRVGLGDVAGVSGANERYVLQWSPDADFSNYSSVKATSTCQAAYVFCYASGAGTDGAATSPILGKGYTAGVQVMSTTTTFSAAANSQIEMEYTIVPMRQMTGQLYYFRLWDVNRSRAIAASSTLGQDFPQFTSEGATAGLTVSGVNSNSTIVPGLVTTATTTSTTTPFGAINSSSTVAHLLSVNTNAQEGYRLDLSLVTNLTSAAGAVFATTTGSNASPATWSSSCLASNAGCLGYHTTAGQLTGGSTRFSVATDTWAGPVAGALEEIGYSNYPTSTTQYVVYKAVNNGLVPAGNYNAEIKYILTPVY